MIIRASERTRLLREKDAYVQKYNEQKTAWESEKAKFKEDSDNYINKVAEELKSLVAYDLAKLPGAVFEVKHDSYTSRGNTYFIYMSYRSPKADNPTRYRNAKSYSNDFRGFYWTYYIYLYFDYNTETLSLRKEPQIRTELLEADDFEVMKATYELFSKIEVIDWDTLLRKVNNEVPKEDDYVKTPNPGYMDTRPWDEKIDNYDVTRIVGKDTWIKVQIHREESYDRWSDYSNAKGVDGTGWIKVESQTDKFYTFNWLSCRDREGSDDNFSENQVTRALRYTYRLKKIYFSIVKPIQYMTTEELTEETYPE